MSQEPEWPADQPKLTGPGAEGDAETYKAVFTEETAFVDQLVQEHGRDAAAMMLIERLNKLRNLSFVTKIRMNCDYMRIDQLKSEVTADTREKLRESDRRYQPAKRSTEEKEKKQRAEPKTTEEKAIAALMKRLNVSEDQARAMLKMVPNKAPEGES